MASYNLYEALFYKRKSFSHEREFRIILFDNKQYHQASRKISEVGNIKDPIFSEFGTNIDCSLNLLIDEIYISPFSHNWFKDLISSVITKYNLNKEIIHSRLYRKPADCYFL